MEQGMKRCRKKKFIRAYHAINKLAENGFLDKRFTLRCLNKSTALFFASRHFGVNATLKMGMRHYGRFLSGHAWIEVDGKPIDESLNVADYVVFYIKTNINEGVERKCIN